MPRTVFYERFHAAIDRSPFLAQDPASADVLFPEEDTAIETNWPRYGDPASAFARGTFNRTVFWEEYSGYIDGLKQRPEAMCILCMHPDLAMARRLSGCASKMVADINLLVPHRDENPRSISMPALPLVTGTGGNAEPTVLASFRGANSHPVREVLARSRNEPDIVVDLLDAHPQAGAIDAEAGKTDREYAGLLAASSFAFVPRGDRAFSYRLLEVMSFGCIPVVLADGLVLPFDRLIDWGACALHVPEAEAGTVVERIRAIPPDQVAAMRHNVMQTYRTHLDGFDRICRALIAEISILHSTSP